MRPESEKIFESGQSDKQTVCEAVEEEQDEELVVVECHAVVDPGTVMVHLEDTVSTHGTMMHSVWLDAGTLLTVPH